MPYEHVDTDIEEFGTSCTRNTCFADQQRMTWAKNPSNGLRTLEPKVLLIRANTVLRSSSVPYSCLLSLRFGRPQRIRAQPPSTLLVSAPFLASTLPV
ncbi:hypothetical protein GOBAR_DD09097 [Gossypium barbadense]|nr:hypothetical protein GOBAR_DD09097 [Gossypium barbadense]